MKVAIIPARGGSKRIPNKNIKNFLGQPIISYSIKAAQRCGIFDKIVVSTDSSAIADVAKSYNAEVPFFRTRELSDDITPLSPVIKNAIELIEKTTGTIESACCILPTAPMIQISLIKKGLNYLDHTSIGCVASVTSFAHPVLRSFFIDETGLLKSISRGYEFLRIPDFESYRSNDLPQAYHDAGQFYWLDARLFLKDPNIFRLDNAMPIVVPRNFVQDIDTPEDWLTAEIIYETNKRRGLL